MSPKSIKTLLDKIEQNKPINLQRFYRLIESLNLGIRYNPSDIKAVKVSSHNYRITHLPVDLRQALYDYAQHIADDRISSARQNLSHAHKVMGSYLLLIPDAHLAMSPSNTSSSIAQSLDKNTHPPYPIVVMIDEQGMPSYPPYLPRLKRDSNCTPAKDALIVENRQLFLHWQRTQSFLQTHCQFASTCYDIIFGAGNDISNSLHKAVLSSYHRLYILSDVDYGGVVITSNLIKLLPNNQIHFVMPDDIEQRLEKVSRHISANEVSSIRQVCSQHDELALAGQMISKTHKTLEQESYLYE